jgi:hypothetical protein
LSGRLVSTEVVAIFVLVKGCPVQNISVWPLATRELLCANREGYGTIGVYGGAFSGRMLRGAQLHERFGHDQEVAG